MREIKFRITYQHEETGRFTSRVIKLGDTIPNLGLRWIIVGQDQFIGLPDKNGKEIYEGDIVQSTMPIFGYIQQEVIELDEIGYGCRPFVELAGAGWQSATSNECEIIGNIYENQELLEAV